MQFLYILTGKWKPMRWSFVLSIIGIILLYLDANNKDSQYYKPDSTLIDYLGLWVIIFILTTVLLYVITWILNWLIPQD